MDIYPLPYIQLIKYNISEYTMFYEINEVMIGLNISHNAITYFKVYSVSIFF